MDNYGYQPEENNSGPFAITRYATRKVPNDYLVEVNSRGKIFKKPGFYKALAIVFFILAIIFLIALIVVLIYNNRKPTVCTSDECLRTATNLKFSLDLSVDPCQNFYQYTCGKWSEEHPSHGWWSSFSSFTTITEKVAISSLKVLTSESTSENEPEALNKSRDFFKSCMDQDAMDKLGLTAMYKYIKKSFLPIVPAYINTPEDERTSYKFDWMRTDAALKQIFMMDVFIGATVDANIFKGTENVIYLGLPFQKSPLPSPLKKKRSIKKYSSQRNEEDDDDDKYSELVKEANKKIIKYVIKLITLNETGQEVEDRTLDRAANIILDMSDDLDEITSNFTDSEQTEDDTYSIKISSLQSQTNNDPDSKVWLTYLNYLFDGANVTIDPTQELIYITDVDLQYMKRFLEYIFGIPDIHVELYMWWATVYAMIINTSSDMVEYVVKQIEIVLPSSTSVVKTKAVECAIMTNNYMGYAVSYALADETFPNTTKPKVENMVKELKQAFVDHVNKIDWMDKETKRVTLEKSKEMITFIGYPDWLFKNGELDKHYKDVTIKPDAYLDNMMELIISYSQTKLKSLRQMHKRDWHSEPIEVNAFNSFSDNAINVPMAILNFPMYHLGLEVLNYGSIGSILGHELTHGFDNTGRKHDKYGNFVQWWSNKTIEKFDNLTQCFIQQYDNFTIEGVEGHVKGEYTLGENLADNGGLNQAFAAYKNRVKKYGKEQKLPGFENFTIFQLFFIAYGSIWCETNTVEDLKDQLQYDEHCPNSIRVIGTLQNSDDFAEAFHCPIGSYMNPEKKCKIW